MISKQKEPVVTPSLTYQSTRQGVKTQSLTYGCIFECENFYYRYMGSFKEFANYKKLKTGDKISVGTFVIEYGVWIDSCLRVRAVYKHNNGRFYYIPGTFSLVGSLDISGKQYTLKQVGKNAPKYLNSVICQKVCPGYMDN